MQRKPTQINPEIEEKPPIEPTEIEAIEKMTAFERSLSDCVPGDYVVVTRLKPDEYSGILERIFIEPDKPIDINYFIKKWGGHLLRIRLYGPSDGQKGGVKGGYDLKLYSFDPCRNGKPLPRLGSDGQPEQSYPITTPQQQPMIDPMVMVTKVMEMAKAMIPSTTHSGDQSMELLKMFLAMNRPANPTAELTRALGLMKELKSFAGIGSAEDAEGDGLFGKILNVAERYLAMNQNQPPSLMPSTSLAPKNAPVSSALPPNILQTISDMEEEQIAGILTSFLQNIDPIKREKLENSIASAMGWSFGEDNVDNSINSSNNQEHEEEANR